jgi:hypothetical protein
VLTPSEAEEVDHLFSPPGDASPGPDSHLDPAHPGGGGSNPSAPRGPLISATEILYYRYDMTHEELVAQIRGARWEDLGGEG